VRNTQDRRLESLPVGSLDCHWRVTSLSAVLQKLFLRGGGLCVLAKPTVGGGVPLCPPPPPPPHLPRARTKELPRAAGPVVRTTGGDKISWPWRQALAAGDGHGASPGVFYHTWVLVPALNWVSVVVSVDLVVQVDPQGRRKSSPLHGVEQSSSLKECILNAHDPRANGPPGAATLKLCSSAVRAVMPYAS
jgi:hypothetical protein